MNPEQANEASLSTTDIDRDGQNAKANGVVPCQPEDELLEDEDYNYNPVPPRRVVTYKVRIKVIGRGKPLPYPLDEEDEE